MNGKRCAISLGSVNFGDIDQPSRVELFVAHWGEPNHELYARIYGSHSEAKRELKKWLPAWPDAKIVDEEDL